jgi:hypothetical protein
VALSRLEGEQALPFADQQLSARISQAVIGNERGGDVAAMAAAALDDHERAGEGSPEVPTYLSATFSSAVWKQSPFHELDRVGSEGT